MFLLIPSLLVDSAMAPIDWFALILCSYLVGLTVAAEVKDIALVEMAIDNNIKELSTGWRVALGVLASLRAHFFMQPLMAIVPLVVQAKGGGALDICFK